MRLKERQRSTKMRVEQRQIGRVSAPHTQPLFPFSKARIAVLDDYEPVPAVVDHHGWHLGIHWRKRISCITKSTPEPVRAGLTILHPGRATANPQKPPLYAGVQRVRFNEVSFAPENCIKK